MNKSGNMTICLNWKMSNLPMPIPPDYEIDPQPEPTKHNSSENKSRLFCCWLFSRFTKDWNFNWCTFTNSLKWSMICAFAGLCSFIRSGDIPFQNWLVRIRGWQRFENRAPTHIETLLSIAISSERIKPQCCAKFQNEVLLKVYQVDGKLVLFRCKQIWIFIDKCRKLCPVRSPNRHTQHAVFNWVSFLQEWSQGAASPLQSQMIAKSNNWDKIEPKWIDCIRNF